MRRTACLLILVLATQSHLHAASREPARARHGMVTSASEIASNVGVEILQKGGTAVDAAVATSLALAVVWPQAGNLGGGGFLLIQAASGKTETIDYRERAPAGASRDMFLDAQGNVIPDASTVGYRAVAVPGTLAGLELAHKRHGRLPWKDLVEPARRLAADGFVLNWSIVHDLDIYRETLSQFPESKRIFLRNGNYFQDGDRLIQPELAATLKRIQELGPREFYEGTTAELIVADMRANGGAITYQDLKDYEPVIRKPLEGSYRGYGILTMPPPSSGGVVLLELLNMMESANIAAKGFHSADHLHFLVECMRRAFADRAGLLGDPDFVPVPTTELISKEYALQRLATIAPNRATRSSAVSSGIQPPVESPDTTHFTIVDSSGSVVACTTTLNNTFGSGATVRGAGFLLNNEMDDFTAKPGTPNLYGLLQGDANAIAPRKRPLSSMTPTIVLKDGKPLFALGSPGGPTIINSVLQVISNIIDFGMNVQQAVDAPRFHHQWMPDKIYFDPMGLNPDTRALMEKREHVFSDKTYYDDSPYFGNVQIIWIDPRDGFLYGASDPRDVGIPAGY